MCLLHLWPPQVQRDELLDDEEYADILEDCTAEVAKYGKLRRVAIPRPAPPAADPPGVGLVFMCFEEPEAAGRARVALHGRAFGEGAVLEASLFDPAAFEVGNFS